MMNWVAKKLRFLSRAGVMLLVVAIAGCGSESEERSTAPVLVVSEFAVPEESTASFDLALFAGTGDIDRVEIINEQSRNLFQIDRQNTSADLRTIRVNLVIPLDFERPEDINQDNVFDLELAIFQGERETRRPFSVRILDIEEPTDFSLNELLIIGRNRGDRLGQKALAYGDFDGDGFPDFLVSYGSGSRSAAAVELIHSRAVLTSDNQVLDLRTTTKTQDEIGVRIMRRTRMDAISFRDGVNFDELARPYGAATRDIVVSGYNTDEPDINFTRVPAQAFFITGNILLNADGPILLDNISSDTGAAAGFGAQGTALLNPGGFEFGQNDADTVRVDGTDVVARPVKVGNVFSSVGDVTGDGIPDVAFCMEPEDANAIPVSRVAIIDGLRLINSRRGIDITSVATTGNGALLFDRNVTAGNPGHLCNDIFALGDIDGDSIDDFAFSNFEGNPGSEPGQISGEVIIVSGAIVAAEMASEGDKYIDITGYSVEGTMVARSSGFPFRQFLGYSISPAGDLNADGFNDFLIGAPGQITDGQPSLDPRPGEPGFRANQGRVFIVYGRSNFFTATDGLGQRIFELEPNLDPLRPVSILGGADGSRVNELSNGFGFSVTALDDVRGDGAPEIFVGSPFDGTFGRRPRFANSVRLFEGSIFQNPGIYDSLVGARGYIYEGTSNPDSDGTLEGVCNEQTGFWTVGTGPRRDFDRDGRQDLIFTAPCADGTFDNAETVNDDYGHVYMLRSTTMSEGTGNLDFLERLFRIPPPP